MINYWKKENSKPLFCLFYSTLNLAGPYDKGTYYIQVILELFACW